MPIFFFIITELGINPDHILQKVRKIQTGLFQTRYAEIKDLLIKLHISYV